MKHINYTSVKPWLQYKSTAWVREVCVREDLAEENNAPGISQYFAWVKVISIEPGRTLQRHASNCHELWYVHRGKGRFEAGGVEKDLTTHATIYFPPLIPHKVENTHPTEHLVILSWGVTDKPDHPNVEVSEVSEGEGPKLDDFKTYNWFEDKNAEPNRAHMKTAWWYNINAKLEQPFPWCGMQVIQGTRPNDTHMHNYEMFYFVESGKGVMRVKGESFEVTAGSLIYIKEMDPHTCASILEDGNINTLCVMMPVPHTAERSDMRLYSFVQGGKMLNPKPVKKK